MSLTSIVVAERVRWTNSHRASTAHERLVAFEIGNKVFELMAERVEKHPKAPTDGLHKVVGPMVLTWSDREYGPRNMLNLRWELAFRSSLIVNGVVLEVRTDGTPDERSSRSYDIATKILNELQRGASLESDESARQQELQVAAVTVPANLTASA